MSASTQETVWSRTLGRSIGLPWRRVEDWRAELADAGLSSEIARTIETVVLKARLWRSERLDVARELIAHFRDAREAGAEPEAQLRSFGDPVAAAKLIRRGKLRNRPWWWQANRRASWVMGGLATMLLLSYAWFGVLAMRGQPKIATDYVRQFRAEIEAAKPELKAWPVYEALHLELKVPSTLTDVIPSPDGNPWPTNSREYRDGWPQRPGDPRWPEAAAWVDSKKDAISQLRAATKLPMSGAPWRVPRLDKVLPVQEPKETVLASSVSMEPGFSMMLIELPHLGKYRAAARLLVVDARRAIEVKDGDRFVDDISAMLRIGVHAKEDGMLISQLVAQAIWSLAFSTVTDQLGYGALNRQQLTRLAHEASALDDRVTRLEFDFERASLRDFIQRTYTDDGQGDGRFTIEGCRALAGVGSMAWLSESQSKPDADLADRELMAKAASPIAIALFPRRKEVERLIDETIARAQLEADTPGWLRGESNVDDFAEGIRGQKVLFVIPRHPLLSIVMSAFGKAARSSDFTRQQRDGALVSIALQAHRLEHGEYPLALSVLSPTLLPAVPPDRFSGKPIRYRLYELAGKQCPLVYSIGVDRVDGGGFGPNGIANGLSVIAFKPPSFAAALSSLDKTSPQTKKQMESAGYLGDWVLYDPAGLTSSEDSIRKPRPAGLIQLSVDEPGQAALVQPVQPVTPAQSVSPTP